MGFFRRAAENRERRRQEAADNERAAEHVVRGDLDGRRYQWADAIEEFNKAISLASDPAILCKAHAGAFLAHGASFRREEAMRHYEAIKQIDPAAARRLEATPAFTATKRMGQVFFG